MNYIERGMIKCINSEFGSSGQSNVPAHCKAVKLAGLSSKSSCKLMLHEPFKVLVHSCVQFAVKADQEKNIYYTKNYKHSYIPQM